MNMDQQKELRQEIEKLMKKYGTTQSFIADKVGVSRTTINLWINNKKVLPEEVYINVKNWHRSLQ